MSTETARLQFRKVVSANVRRSRVEWPFWVSSGAWLAARKQTFRLGLISVWSPLPPRVVTDAELRLSRAHYSDSSSAGSDAQSSNGSLNEKAGSSGRARGKPLAVGGIFVVREGAQYPHHRMD